MSRELLIMRHAESGWGAASDFERTLTLQGQQAAAGMGAWLKAEGLLPDHVVSSPAQRAKETVLTVCDALALGPSQIVWQPEIYEASLETLMRVLQQLPEQASRILMVGHNPGLAQLVQHLAGAGGAGFSPATIAVLGLNRVVAGGAQLRVQKQPVPF